MRTIVSAMLQGYLLRYSLVTAVSAALFVLSCVGSLCAADEKLDGKTLFQRHCSPCHLDGSKMLPHIPLEDKLGKPPVGMPVFGKDRLTGQDVQAIEKYLWPDAAVSRMEQTPPSPPGPERSSKGKDKKAWLKGFGTAD